MSVSATLDLGSGSQPGTGLVRFLPYGGDGIYEPVAAYGVDDFELASDASGGTNTLIVQMDTKYTSLISYVTILNKQATPADIEYRMTIGGAGAVPAQNQGIIESLASGMGAGTINKTWQPPAILLPQVPGEASTFTARIINTDGDDFALSLLVMLFDIDAAQKSSRMGLLLSGRGSFGMSQT